ncbi:MAG: hypothetical protein WDM87_01725 [Terracidiphilus sp.]
MPTLREKLADAKRFLIATELVSVRGSMAGVNAIKARDFANDLVACPEIDWISITIMPEAIRSLRRWFWAGQFCTPEKKS